jgi:hypothetical protein
MEEITKKKKLGQVLKNLIFFFIKNNNNKSKQGRREDLGDVAE